MSVKKHVPAPGKAVGLYGEALCGRLAHYATGDHDQIRRLAAEGGDHWCRDCVPPQPKALKAP